MTNVEDVKDLEKESNVQVLSDEDGDIEVKETKEGGEEEEVSGDDDDEEFDGEDDDDDDDDDDDEEDDEEEEDLGTEYLVRPVGDADDEEDASDFEPEETAVEEDLDEEDEEEDVDDVSALSAGKSDPLAKRKRVPKEQGDGAGEEERPSKRLF